MTQRGFPIRWLLVAFAVVLLGPILALAAVALSRDATSKRNQYMNEVRQAARQIAADLDHELGKVQAAAQALATSRFITNGDYEAFQQQASEFLRTWALDEPDSYTVVLRDLSSQQLVNTCLPWGTPLPKMERDLDKPVITTKRPQVQDLFFSESANQLAVAVRAPVIKDGEVTHVLSIRLEPKHIADLLQVQGFPIGWNRIVVDRNSRIVARWSQRPRHGHAAGGQLTVGAQTTEEFRSNVVGDEGSWVSTNREGIQVLAAYTRSKLSGWYVVVGTPLSVLQEPDRRWRRIVMALSLAGLILLIGLTFWFGRRIARPIHVLELSADQLAKGQSVLPVTTGLREIDAVGRALALASKELRERENALRELNLSLERRVEARTREIERMGEANRRVAITRERLRMARNLHDTLAHSLLALISPIRLIRKLMSRDPAAVEAELARAEEAAHEGLAQARAAVEELRYQAIGEEGLGPALERLAARLRAKTSLEITLHVDPAATGLENEKAEVLYRIAEEAVRNVERHSAAEHVDVSVRVDHLDGTERVSLTVADDGVGFDPGATPSGHYGLTGMREQAELIRAELRLDSAPGQGTRVLVSVPV